MDIVNADGATRQGSNRASSIHFAPLRSFISICSRHIQKGGLAIFSLPLSQNEHVPGPHNAALDCCPSAPYKSLPQCPAACLPFCAFAESLQRLSQKILCMGRSYRLSPGHSRLPQTQT